MTHGEEDTAPSPTSSGLAPGWTVTPCHRPVCPMRLGADTPWQTNPPQSEGCVYFSKRKRHACLNSAPLKARSLPGVGVPLSRWPQKETPHFCGIHSLSTHTHMPSVCCITCPWMPGQKRSQLQPCLRVLGFNNGQCRGGSMGTDKHPLSGEPAASTHGPQCISPLRHTWRWCQEKLVRRSGQQLHK